MPLSPEIESKVKESFRRQRFMGLLGAKIKSIEPGRVGIVCALNAGLTQQHGFFHAGVLASVLDSACGYAALTTMPENSEVVSVEFKINMLRSCDLENILAVGTVLKSGRTLVVCEGEVSDETRTVIYAKMIATMFALDATKRTR